MTCEVPLGVCQLCYGTDFSTGELVERGTPVGIIAAQSIGEPGMRLTLRSLRHGGVVRPPVLQSRLLSDYDGVVGLVNCEVLDAGSRRRVVVGRDPAVEIRDRAGHLLARYSLPAGAEIRICTDAQVRAGQVIAEWDGHGRIVLARVGGRARYVAVVEGLSVRREWDAVTGHGRLVVREDCGLLRPTIVIEDLETGAEVGRYPLPHGASIEVADGELVQKGTLLARVPQDQPATGDIMTALRRIVELFELRHPQRCAVLAEIDGVVEVLSKRFRGKRIVRIVNERTRVCRDHYVPVERALRVRTGDPVGAGDPLCEGPVNPHDILRIAGEEPVQQLLAPGNSGGVSGSGGRLKTSMWRSLLPRCCGK